MNDSAVAAENFYLGGSRPEQSSSAVVYVNRKYRLQER